jgi:hypothetical protein
VSVLQLASLFCFKRSPTKPKLATLYFHQKWNLSGIQPIAQLTKELLIQQLLDEEAVWVEHPWLYYWCTKSVINSLEMSFPEAVKLWFLSPMRQQIALLTKVIDEVKVSYVKVCVSISPSNGNAHTKSAMVAMSTDCQLCGTTSNRIHLQTLLSIPITLLGLVFVANL